MACSKWEETGLLYSSNELDDVDARQFQDHLCSCSECKAEYELYKKECSLFYNIQILSETPSEKVDKEILRVCSNPRKQVTSFGILSVFLKKTAVSVTFFVVGFLVIGYFAMNIQNVQKAKQNIVADKINDSTAQVPLQYAQNVVDSASTPQDSNQYFSKTRGNLNLNGVYPIDLKSK